MAAFDSFNQAFTKSSLMEFEKDYYLNEMQTLPTGNGHVLFAGSSPTGHISKPHGCSKTGNLVLENPSQYLVCSHDTNGGFSQKLFDCGAGYIFISYAGLCVHISAKNILHTDSGLLFGPGQKSPESLLGEISPFDISEFKTYQVPHCIQNGALLPFGYDNRFYISCHNTGKTENN